MLTENRRKELTEYIGECWHTMNVVDHNGLARYQAMKCEKCGYTCSVGLPSYHTALPRTFTTPDDKDVLLRAIDNNFHWEEFMYYLFGKRENLQKAPFVELSCAVKYISLLSPLETAELVCKWKGWE